MNVQFKKERPGLGVCGDTVLKKAIQHPKRASILFFVYGIASNTVKMNFVMVQKSMESDVKAKIWQKKADAHSNPFATCDLPASDLERFEGGKY